ncbi:MAG: LemA family protein, partial [Candidatus Diapherotrites archaeon]
MITLILIGLAIILAIAIVWAILAYNGFVTLRNQIENSWSQIDVQLKRRYDLVPNLVETVKGYAKYEKETFEKVVEARNKIMTANNPKQRAEAENML